MIEIAKILKPQGIHGEVKTQLFSDNVDSFCARGFAYRNDGGRYQRILYTPVRTDAQFIYLHIDGVDTRNDAELLRGVFLYMDRDEFDDLDDGEYYVCDLVGLRIEDEKGSVLGELKEVLQHGAADVYVVKAAKGFMFPALKRVIQNVDIKAGVMKVNSAALAEVAVYDD